MIDKCNCKDPYFYAPFIKEGMCRFCFKLSGNPVKVKPSEKKL